MLLNLDAMAQTELLRSFHVSQRHRVLADVMETITQAAEAVTQEVLTIADPLATKTIEDLAGFSYWESTNEPLLIAGGVFLMVVGMIIAREKWGLQVFLFMTMGVSALMTCIAVLANHINTNSTKS